MNTRNKKISRSFQNWLLVPAAKAAMNAAGYIDAAMGSGYAASKGIAASAAAAPTFIGSWNPMILLLLLLSVTIAVCLVAVLGNPNPKTTEVAEETEGDDKFESFFSGEKAVFSQVGGSDLFWGFKHNWRKYFSFMHDWHSGVVNDYALYGAAAIAVVLALCVIFL